MRYGVSLSSGQATGAIVRAVVRVVQRAGGVWIGRCDVGGKGQRSDAYVQPCCEWSKRAKRFVTGDVSWCGVRCGWNVCTP